MTSRRPAARLLLAECNAVNSRLLSAIFAAQGYVVRAASDAEGVLRAAGRRWPEVVLVDLPGRDSLEVVRRLKAAAGKRRLFAVGVLRTGGRGPRAAARRAGCDACVAKPLDPRELSRVIAKARRRRRP
jgi:two-component system, OmpR family, response regulator ResD